MLDILRAELSKVAPEIFRESEVLHAHEEIYLIALCTSAKYGFCTDLVGTVAGLERAAVDFLEDSHNQKRWENLSAVLTHLRWRPAGSPYFGEFGDRFSKVNEVLARLWASVDPENDEQWVVTCKGIHDQFVDALEALRDTHNVADRSVVFTIVSSTQSDEEVLLNAEELNTPSVVARVRADLDINEEVLVRLRKNRWAVQ